MFNFTEVAKKLERVKMEIADHITMEQSQKYPDQLGRILKTLKNERIKLIELYEEILVEDFEIALDKISEWGKHTGAVCCELGISIDIAIDEMNCYREKISDIILEVSESEGAIIHSYHEALKKLHKLIDKGAQCFSIAYVKFQNEMMKKARMEIEELSIPVVPLEKGVAVLPLVGTIDTYRAKLLMEESLKKCAKYHVSHFVLDLSGVPIVDTMVANQIFQVIDALRLLGVHAVISGIRPEIAQTMVALGIEFKTIETYSTLEQAMSEYRNQHKNQ